VVTGSVLFLVAVTDAIDLDPRLFAMRRFWSELLLRRDVTAPGQSGGAGP
jgi:hypothetical protein